MTAPVLGTRIEYYFTKFLICKLSHFVLTVLLEPKLKLIFIRVLILAIEYADIINFIKNLPFYGLLRRTCKTLENPFENSNLYIFWPWIQERTVKVPTSKWNLQFKVAEFRQDSKRENLRILSPWNYLIINSLLK